MERISKVKKYEILFSLFPEKDVSHSVGKVLYETNYPNQATLRTVLYLLRKNGYADIRIEHGIVERVK